MKTYKREDIYIVLTVFIVTAIHTIGALWAVIDTRPVYAGTRFTHATFFYPLEMTLAVMALSVFLVKWARRVKACARTETVARMYVGLTAWSLLHILFNFSYTCYLTIFVLIVGSMITVALWNIRSEIRKRLAQRKQLQA